MMQKYALVTGASRGIGRAVAVKLAQMSYHVLLNYHSQHEQAQETLKAVEAVGGSGTLMPFDVSDYEVCVQELGKWSEKHPDAYIEVLVNNAGIRKDNLMFWMEKEEWDRVLGISLNGFFNITKCLLQPMIRNKFGRIVNMSSLSGIKGMAGQANYAAAKAGLIGATKSLALEVAKKGITVNAIAPGFIRTDMLEDLDEAQLKKIVPAGRLGEAEEVAELLAFLVSKNAGYITGETISINGGLYT